MYSGCGRDRGRHVRAGLYTCLGLKSSVWDTQIANVTTRTQQPCVCPIYPSIRTCLSLKLNYFCSITQRNVTWGITEHNVKTPLSVAVDRFVFVVCVIMFGAVAVNWRVMPISNRRHRFVLSMLAIWNWHNGARTKLFLLLLLIYTVSQKSVPP